MWSEWVKSSYSFSNGNCVERRKSSHSHANGSCVQVRDAVQVRDSQNTSGPVLTFTPVAWSAFIMGLKAA